MMDRLAWNRYGGPGASSTSAPGVGSDMSWANPSVGFYGGASGGAGVSGQAGVQLTGLAVLALTAALAIAFYHLR